MLTETAIRAAKPREKSYKLFDGGLNRTVSVPRFVNWELASTQTLHGLILVESVPRS
jgi:hypothetical protein